MSSRHSGVSTSSSSSEMDYSSGPSFLTYTSAPLPLLERTSVISTPSQYSPRARPASTKTQRHLQRQYWSSPLPLQVQIKEELDTEDSQEEVTDDSLLEKYIHKKFSKSKTFSSVLRPSDFEIRKRQSVIVQAPSSSF